MSIFQWNSDFYLNEEEELSVNDILRREQQLRELARTKQTVEASEQIFSDAAKIAGSFYESAVLSEEPSYNKMVSYDVERQERMRASVDQPSEEKVGIEQTPSYLVDLENGQWTFGNAEFPSFWAVDSSRDASWLSIFGMGDSNRSISATNAQASYIRSALYTTSPFSTNALSRLTEAERTLIPQMSNEIKDRLIYWRKYGNNWERLAGTVWSMSPLGIGMKLIQGEAPSLDGVPILDQFQILPDQYFGSYRDPNFNGGAVLGLLKKYEPEKYQYLLSTGMDFEKLTSSKSIFDFYYHANSHITQVAITNAALDLQTQNPSWAKEKWTMAVRPFISGTLNDADMPVDLAITAITLGSGGAYVIAKNLPRLRYAATTAERAENFIRLKNSLDGFKRFQESAALLVPSNWATIALNRGTRDFAEKLASYGTRGQVTRYIAYNATQGAIEGAAYYQLNWYMNQQTQAEKEWSFGDFTQEVIGEAVGQVFLGPVMNAIHAGAMNLTTFTGKQAWANFKPSNTGVAIEPSKVKRLFNEVTQAMKIDPDKWNALSQEDRQKVAMEIDLNMQLHNLLEIVQPKKDTTPYIVNTVFNSYSGSIDKAMAVESLREVALVIQGKSDSSTLDPETKAFIEAVKSKYGDNLSSLQVGALLLESLQRRASKANIGTGKSVTDSDASQILNNMVLLSVLETKATEMNIKLTDDNIDSIHKSLKEEGDEAVTKRIQDKLDELQGIAELRPGGLKVNSTLSYSPAMSSTLTTADLVDIAAIIQLKPRERLSPSIRTTEGDTAISEAMERLSTATDTPEAAPEALAEAPTEAAPEALAEAPTEAAPEALAEAPAEAAPEALAEAPAEAAPEAPAEVTTTPPTTKDIDTLSQEISDLINRLTREETEALDTLLSSDLEKMSEEERNIKIRLAMEISPRVAEIFKKITDC